MENLDVYIDGLANRVRSMAEDRSRLLEENVKLRNRNEELERIINEQKNVLNRLEEENKVVKIAKAVADDESDRQEQKKRLNELVREIDKCIALLNN